MLAQRLKDGRTAYYWSPQKRVLHAGCTLRREALGLDYTDAIAKAELLNRHFDVCPQGRDAPKDLDLRPDFGSLKWLAERYKRSRACDKVSARSRIQHHKTGELVWLPLSHSEGPFFPELDGYLESLERLGVPIVLFKPKGKREKPARPFKP